MVQDALYDGFRAMIDTDDLDPLDVELIARHIAAMPLSTMLERDQRLLAWVHGIDMLRRPLGVSGAPRERAV